MRSSLAAMLFAASVGSGAAQFMGWDVTAANRDERSPLASTPAVATRGKAVFAANCARCHGPDGKGNGPDSDHAADLTDDLRTSLNTEGVLFYKVWNGHLIQLRTAVEDMPAFRDKLSRNDVWAVVEYLKALRTPRPYRVELRASGVREQVDTTRRSPLSRPTTRCTLLQVLNGDVALVVRALFNTFMAERCASLARRRLASGRLSSHTRRWHALED